MSSEMEIKSMQSFDSTIKANLAQCPEKDDSKKAISDEEEKHETEDEDTDEEDLSI